MILLWIVDDIFRTESIQCISIQELPSAFSIDESRPLRQRPTMETIWIRLPWLRALDVETPHPNFPIHSASPDLDR